MEEIKVTISVLNEKHTVSVVAFPSMPAQRLKQLAINKYLTEIKDTLLKENNITDG